MQGKAMTIIVLAPWGFPATHPSCIEFSIFYVSYGDGSYTVGDDSYTVGDCISETLIFNDTASVDNIAHGCGQNIEGIFVGTAGVYKGVTTSQLDELAAETAAAMTANHPDYASRTCKAEKYVTVTGKVGRKSLSR
ncbi:hypothetical protein Scep_025472 [Stephania cephalantha]|uniref:Uncharacterized protein n=1 Tax=Stephania cephalantha TaxID=152367 RepID=A0AAP0HMC4_9MAGN